MKKRSKKWISLLLCLLLIVPFLAVPAGAVSVDNFKDVSKGDWYYEGVKYAVDKKIFAGTSADTFEPQTPMTRAMFVQTLANLTQNYSIKEGNGYFTDVPADAWYKKAVYWAYSYGLIAGTGTNTFSPDAVITREQAATMLYSYTMYTGGNFNLNNLKGVTQFSDYGKISAWAPVSMIWAVDHKVMAGVGNNTLDPQGTLTRAQAAQLFKNMQGVIDDEPYVYSRENGEDLGFDFEHTVNMSFGELKEKLGEPIKEEIVDYSNKPYYIHEFTFATYPNVKYLFWGLQYNETPPDDRKPHAITTTLKNVMPDIVGLSLGEAVKLTKGALVIHNLDFFNDYNAVNPELFFADYYTEKYSVSITFKGTGNIDGDSGVAIYNSINPPPG